MTPQTSAAARLALDPATTDATLATIFGALRHDPERTPAQFQVQRDAGAALIAALRPHDPVEAAYAARATAAHYASMECFRRAILPDTPDNAAIRWHGRAMALSRMNKDMIRELRDSQAETQHAQPQPAAQPAIAKPAVARDEDVSLALAVELARRRAAVRAKPAGTQACPRALDPRDPKPSERTSFTPAAPAIAPQPEAALVAKPVGAQAVSPALEPRDAQRAPPGDHISSERPSFTPASSAIMTGPAATSFLSAPPARQSRRARLLSSTADVAAMLAAAKVEARPLVQ